jgi:hypothetical protein
VFNHLAPTGSGETAGFGLVGGLISALVIKVATDDSISIDSETPYAVVAVASAGRIEIYIA